MVIDLLCITQFLLCFPREVISQSWRKVCCSSRPTRTSLQRQNSLNINCSAHSFQQNIRRHHVSRNHVIASCLAYRILDHLKPEDLFCSVRNVCQRRDAITDICHPYQVFLPTTVRKNVPHQIGHLIPAVQSKTVDTNVELRGNRNDEILVSFL